ncbi:MAG: TonB-dependent siderophore receptor [Sphingomonadales bacterium]|nr:TonB-dependent siderophore receptor [Sphingomonadales bacterium]
MKLYQISAALVISLATSGPALADDAADTDAPAIIVTGHMDGYRTVETNSGTKTNTPILDVPQSISVVTSQQIADQQVRSVADLVRYIPGVSAGQGEGNRDQVTLRGNNTTADFFVDGLRDDVQYFRSFYNIDRVEVHKGANAMVFGRGGGGGVINRITKGAIADQNLYAATVSLDTFGSYYGSADVNIALGSAALRVNGFYEDLNNHRDAFSGERYAVNPTVAAELGNTRMELGYEYVRDSRVADRGIPSAFAGTIADPAGPARGFRDTFFGKRDFNDSDFEAHVLRFRSESRLSENLTFKTQALYGDYDKSYSNVFAATAIGGTAAAPTIGIEAYIDPTKRQTYIGQANLEWRVSTGPFEHLLLFGGEITGQNSRNERINGFFSPTVLSSANRRSTVALTDPLIVPPIFFVSGPTGNSNRNVRSNLDQVSAYIQDQISLGEKFDLIGGLRFDRYENDIVNAFTNARVSRVDDLWSPRVGLVYKPVEAASIYVSYSKSYLPQGGDQFVTFDATNAALKPETFDNYEVGAKWNIKPDLTLTVAVYRLDRGNTRATGPTPGTIVQTGKQRSSGFELGLTGRITPRWMTSLGYANTKAEIRETTTAAPAGRRVAQVPRNQISLWNRYEASSRLGLGVGLYYQSRQFASISNATVLPAYTRIDAALFYKLTDKIEAQLNVENLTGKAYFPVAHNDNNISTGAPINGRFTLAAKF